jgi:cell division protein FtsB
MPRTAEPQAQRAQVQQARPAGAGSAGHAHRTSFVILLLGLLGGGMVCLLVVNTTLAANSIQISNLQQQNANVSEQVQELQQQVATARSAGAIEHEARRLGMRPDPHLVFLNLHSKKIVAQPGRRAMAALPAAHSARSRSRHPARSRTGGKTAAGKTAQGGTGQ